jgi:HD-GYP domain-containing protein (c-di-GMP phosphodiesterase class II)
LGCSVNSSRLAATFSTDDHLLKRALRLTNWSATRESTRYLFKHSFPGETGLARAWHSFRLGMQLREDGREMSAARSERGAELAVLLSLPRGTAEAIRAIDEHWDGSGMPQGVSGSGISMLGRIVALAQTVDVFQHCFDVATAYDKAHGRRGRWFDPVLVDCLDAFKLDAAFWKMVRGTDGLAQLRALEPEECLVTVDEARLDTVAEVFAQVIDAKSPRGAGHSANVARTAGAAGAVLGLDVRDLRLLRRAALLHDLGMLGVSNTILDKPTALDPVECEQMRQHTRNTFTILKRVARFRQFAATAAAHHERIDGSGYHLGLKAAELGVNARVLAVADIAEALSADRPYRAGLPADEVARILQREVRSGGLCPDAVAAVLATFAARSQSPPAPAATRAA